jgi:hypothetical protein
MLGPDRKSPRVLGGEGGRGIALIFYREWYRVKETYGTQTDRQITGRKDKRGGQIKRQTKRETCLHRHR